MRSVSSSNGRTFQRSLFHWLDEKRFNLTSCALFESMKKYGENITVFCMLHAEYSESPFNEDRSHYSSARQDKGKNKAEQ